MRCPVNPKVRFGRVLTTDTHVVPGNLIEVACRDCRKRKDLAQVLHRYNPLGQFVETVEVARV